jgi:deoxyadenosine/deoxycytidine kinase
MVVVAGSIAVGKTSLMSGLSERLGLRSYAERWAENPWFGGDERGALPAQLWFLVSAGADHARMFPHGGVQERCIHEHARVFAAELLAGEDLSLLEAVYATLDSKLPDPNALVFLTASPDTLRERVRARGRAQEQGLTIERLQRLDDRYRALIGSWTRCPVIEVNTESTDVRADDGVCHVLALVSEVLQ